MCWRKAAAAALLCVLLLTGCGGTSTTRELNGRPITVTTERDRGADRSLPDATRSLPAEPEADLPPAQDPGAAGAEEYVLNRSSVRFHRPTCAWVEKISPENRIDWTGDRETLIEVGYKPCSVCKP